MLVLVTVYTLLQSVEVRCWKNRPHDSIVRWKRCKRSSWDDKKEDPRNQEEEEEEEEKEKEKQSAVCL